LNHILHEANHVSLAPVRRLPAKLRAWGTRLSLISAMLAGGAQICRAQEASAPSSTEEGAAAQSHSASSPQPPGQSRILWLVPSYGMVEPGTQPPPLTTGQKFKLASEYINPYTFFFVAAEAGINQARNHPADYGQGAEGYGKRFGAGLADGLSDGVFVTGVYPSIFHQDPRYYRLGDGSFSHRAEYAVSRLLVTRQDSGRKAFNISEVLGSFSASALAVTYYPQNERDFSNLAERAGIQFAFDAGFNLLKEFYPEIGRKFSKKRK
jgi:hypothetical protein